MNLIRNIYKKIKYKFTKKEIISPQKGSFLSVAYKEAPHIRIYKFDGEFYNRIYDKKESEEK